MTAIQKYIKRRAKRLASRGIRTDAFDDNYRRDADEENKNGNAGGHGNTRLPYGLCQREGIEIDPKWSPKDAWEALEGKGYSAKESYEELKKTGHVSKKGASSVKTKSQRLQMDGIPSAMRTGAGLKKITAFNTEFKKLEMEEHISDFVANAGKVMGRGQVSDFALSKTRPGSGDHFKVWKNRFTGEIVKARLSIPDLSKVPEEYRASEATTFAHELIHYMNFCQRASRGYGDFTDGDSELSDAVRNSHDKAQQSGIGHDVQSCLEEMGKTWKEKAKKFDTETRTKANEIGERWMKRTEELGMPGKLPTDEYKQYKKERDDYLNQRKEERSWQVGAFGDGAKALSNMYDAITFGRLYDTGLSWFGHGRGYFSGNVNQVKNEMLSIYVELHMVKDKKYLKMFRDDQPELAKALDNTIRKMLKNGNVEGYRG